MALAGRDIMLGDAGGEEAMMMRAASFYEETPEDKRSEMRQNINAGARKPRVSG